MNADKNNKNLDELISGAISRNNLKFDFNKWKQNHKKEIETFKSQTTSGQTPQFTKMSNIWKIIIKNPVTKLAAAAVIIIGVMIVLYLFGGSIHLTNNAFAEMQEAINEVPWIHVISNTVKTSTNDNTENEFWFSPRRKICTLKLDNSSQILWSDYMRHVRQVYDPQLNTITISHEYKQLDELKESPWNYLAPILGNTFIEDVKIIENLEVINGKQIRVFNLTETQDEGMVSFRVLADIKDKLPIALTMEVKDPNGQIVISMEGSVDYPKEGPEDIYEIGVAKDAKIIDQLPTPEAEELLKICRSYRANFTSYISIILSSSGLYPSDIEVDYINGDVSQAGRYYKSLTYYYIYTPAGDISLLDDEIEKGFDTLLGFIKSKSDTYLLHIDLWDGKYTHRVSNLFYDDPLDVKYTDGVSKKETPSYQKSRSMSSFKDICGFAWPYYQPSGKIIQDEYSKHNNLICLKAYNCLFYFDPKHDYICVRREYLDKNSNETGTYHFVREVTEMTQTEDSWWYPCKLEWIQVNLDNDGKEISRQVNNVTEIYIKTVTEFPEGIFDAKNLSKEIE